MKHEQTPPTTEVRWRTGIGILTGRFGAGGIRELHIAPFAEDAMVLPDARVERIEPAAETADAALTAEIERTEEFLRNYMAGRPGGEEPRLDWSGRGAFDIAVWRACRQVPYGKTVSYGELAVRVGRAGAARAVGGAMRRNPLLLLMPCHRVLAGGRAVGGFSAGIEVKRALLRHEAVGIVQTTQQSPAVLSLSI